MYNTNDFFDQYTTQHIRLFLIKTRVAIITGSATDSVTELLGTEALTLLVKGSEHSSFICLLPSAIGVKCDYSLEK